VGRSSPGDDRRRTGEEGESIAAAWYEAHGYTVLDRNWRCELGEIDLVCRLGDTLVICEVKARGSDRFGAPAEVVTSAKQRRLRRLGARWLGEHGGGVAEVRFDVAGVTAGQLAVVEDAF
jgi:putative endonuclease